MLFFILRRIGQMLATMVALTLIVFYMVNLPGNLEKLAKTEGNMRMTDQEVHNWLEKEGFHITGTEPEPETRRAHPRVVRLEWEEGYAAMGTPMDLPVSRAVATILDDALDEPVVRVPLLGGSLPLVWFEEALETPLIIVPIVNHDNNQHAADENLRLGHLWRGIEAYAALLAQLGPALEGPSGVR